MNILVDAKNEYTIRIINILSPMILEGLNSIYEQSKQVSTGENVLKIFQSFLKRIPKWNSDLLNVEINRIKSNCRNFDLLNDLIKASVKANLQVLVYNPFQQDPVKINPEHYKNIDFSEFVHNIYIESAREVWNNPYLFYHNYAPIEIKRNQRDTIELIKKCIEESIRKTLPLKHVLEIYLGDEIVPQVPDDNFEKTITEVDEKNLSMLIKKELDAPFIPAEKELVDSITKIKSPKLLEETVKKTISDKNNSTNLSLNIENVSQKGDENISQKGGEDLSQSQLKVNTVDIKNLDNQIMEILNDDKLKLSDNTTSEKRIEKKKLSETSSDDLVSSNMDTNLKKILKNDLGNSETESSLQFKPEQNSSKYQEIFSNSNNEDNSANSQEKNEEMNKNKFFNNYLQF